MNYKIRTEPLELKILNYLSLRMNLSDKDARYYNNLKKGFEGELIFDTFTTDLTCECLVLNDLLFKLNNTLFQIDSLIFLSDAIYFYEVKNYEGDFSYESDKLFKKPNTEISNPITQLNRTASLFRQLIQNLGLNYTINASVVFINPEFTLYQAPNNKPVIFPTQLNRYKKQLNSIPSKLTNKHKTLADKLISLNIENSPYSQLPDYDYNLLKKGITCSTCSSFSVSVIGYKCVCINCGNQEIIDDAVMRSVKEYSLLFPTQKITTVAIHDWCQIVTSKKSIKRILVKNLHLVSLNRWTYFKNKEE
ncbi:nuclease-related domain-containing protein [Litchfieldia salsa]|uniref:Nuclease-related domain-containing protein n=1 Tax=Litchfieldia salsa TaxID=930152 RepID=A0A1H0PXF0_9BACI|nr:nuclease-related domain-containing protein [Litchfieldia salsa]SDP09753.1 Nuclease-related domain-containing protein [Litchfieldia salsa]